MSKNHFCSSCGVKVGAGLRYCPLCGKYVAENNDVMPVETIESFPKIDQSYTQVERWLKLIRSIFILCAIVVTAINLFFKTEPYWFPYALIGIFVLWRILFFPFKEGRSHITSIPFSGVVISILLMFIDIYGNYFHGTTLGWALGYTVPAVITFTTVVSFVIALSYRKYEQHLTKGIMWLLFASILFLISKIIWFNQFASWPVFMSLLSGFITLVLLFIFKRKRLIKEFNRDFHI